MKKAILYCINKKKSNKLHYLCIYHKLIDSGFRKCMSCDVIIICHKAMTGNIYYQWISLGTWDYLIEKSYIILYQWEKCTKLPYLCIYYKLIVRQMKKYMSCDVIIICHKAMTGSIFYQWITQGTWDVLIVKAILDYINYKLDLYFLMYVFIISSYIVDSENICLVMSL